MESKLYETILKETTGRRDLYIGDWIRAISKGIEQYVNDEIVKLKQELINAEADKYFDTIKYEIQKIHVNNDKI